MKLRSSAAKIAASVSALAMLAQASLAAAQPSSPPEGYQPPPPPADYQNEPAPPPGQYAPPPDESNAPPPAYSDRAQNYDRDYAQRYSAWAAQYCVDRRNTNIAAGAIIGGILGAVLGSNIAERGDRGAGTIVGGALGATAGAAVGASSGPGSCPPGYVVRGGAPGFYYDGPYAPYYGPSVVYGPGWYQPWFFVGGRWEYRPYRSWYWGHRRYWRR